MTKLETLQTFQVARLAQKADDVTLSTDLVMAVSVLLAGNFPGSASAVVVAYERLFGPFDIQISAMLKGAAQ